MNETEMDELVARFARENEIAVELIEQNPDLHPITAYVIAGDIASARRAADAVASGELTAEQSVNRVGSFARWDYALTLVANELLTKEWLADNVCHLWSSSDPDDTNPDYLRLWSRLRRSNGAILRDGRRLPKPKAFGTVTVYRGGPEKGLANGCAWSTDPKVARAFASHGGQRRKIKGGVVIRGEVRPDRVIAYITGRNEAEVIVDPRFVEGITEVGRFEEVPA